MKRLLGIVSAAWLAAFPLAAGAQTAATYQLTDSANVAHQTAGFTCLTSELCLAHVPIDFTGSPFGVSGNPFFVSPAPGATFPISGTVGVSGLGSPFQAGGSIGNTAFGISGTLPAFAATPTFNCGTGCSPATQPISAVALPPPTLGTSGGWTRTLFAGLSTTVQTVKGAAGQLGKLYCDNPNATAIYVETFDVSGTVTLGTTAPTQAYMIPPTNASGFVFSLVGDQYANAIKIAAVTAENGSTAPAAPGNCNVSWN